MTRADMTAHERVFFGAGFIAAYRLTPAEWAEKREHVARRIYESREYAAPFETAPDQDTTD